MPFDLEDVLPGLDLPRFKAAPANEQQPDDVAGVVHCNCPVCSGALSVVEGKPVDPQAFLNAEERGGPVPGGHPSKTIPEAAYQLNRTYASWNDFYIQPGVSDVDNHWDDPYWGGAPSVVTFAFRSTAPGTMPDDTAGFTRFTEAQINATLLALQSWADVANIVFVRVGEGTSGNGAYSNNATILFSNYASGADGAAAFGYYPSLSANGGDVWVNYSLNNNKNPAQGNYGMLTLVHEIGHAIGFSHPGDYNAGEGGGPITYAGDAEYYEDSHQFTVMSYFTEDNTGAYYGVAYPAAPQLDDIAAAQRTYGVNTTTRTGDTVYGFNSTADRPWFSITNTSTTAVFAIWDAGGVDTLDFSGYSTTQTIDLRQGHFSSVGTWIGNVAIAMGAIIENAIGGSGTDTIFGNAAANTLTGNAGNDTLTGEAGADIFVVTIGGGADTVTDFTVGSDKIGAAAFGSYVSIAQNGANTVVTFAGGVTITLLGVTAGTITNSSFLGLAGSMNEITGTAAGETLNGTAAADAIHGLAGDDILNGLDADDVLDGGADNDTLNGGSGADAMNGGAGNDTYVVDNAGDTITELAGEGTDTVQTNLASYTLSAQLENLTGTAATGQTLTGNAGVNVITGGSGADTLNGLGGADAMTGGAGNDTYVVDNAGDTTVELAGGGSDTVQTTLASYGLAAEIEHLTGTSASGQALTGNSLNNTITGGTGADTLTGGAGVDTLTGGAAADVFVVSVGGGADTVTDFVVGTDKIDVSAFSGYQSIVQSGADTLITVAAGVTIRLTGITASTVTSASFIGIPAGPTVINGTTGNNILNGTSGEDHIFGLAGNDTLHGLEANDWIEGDLGIDKLYGDAGDDKLEGGDGNDTLDGGTGADEMIGGIGDDIYVIDSAGDVVTEAAAAGTDTVQTSLAAYTLGATLENLTGTSAGAQALTGNAVANTVNGGAAGDTLGGLDGDDKLYGAAGSDSIDGGVCADQLEGADGSDTVQGGLGADYLYGGADNDTLAGGADLDRLFGDDGDDTISGDDGNDIIQGGLGADRITGGAGNDTLTGGDGADVFVVTIAGGIDSVADFVVGTDKVDLTAFGGYLTLAQNGADTLITFAAGVTLRLKGITASTVTAASFIGLPSGPTYNVINGTAVGETLNGTAAADHILGLGGADTITGGGAADLLEGGADADIFVATVGGGGDTVSDFTIGSDKIDVTAFGGIVGVVQQGADALVTVSAGVTFLLLNTTASAVTAASFIGIPTGPNVINGTAAAESINGTAGADHISGLGGIDTIRAGDGDDWIEGGEGDDRLYGDGGNDLVEGGIGADQAFGRLGDDEMDGGDGADKLYGDEGDDGLTGGLGADFLYGGADNDTLSGGDDLDRLYGDDGDDEIDGGAGNDIIQGGLGADRITGGAGNDTLTGGDGAEIYVVTAGGGADTVIDFVAGTDRIDLSAFGGYQTIAQVNADTVITFAAGVTMRLIGVTAASLTDASFIGLPPPPSYNLINGTGAGETINGTAAADEIHGLAGADTLSGGLGDDLLVGGADADIFVATAGGGADTVSDFTVGSDRIDVTAFGSIVGVTQVGSDALVQVSAGVSFLLTGVSAAAIGSSSFIGLPPPPPFNVINGTAGAENLYGTAEDDHILAGDSADRAYGAGGDDWLEGQVGADKLYGDEGADLVVGGAGGDYLYGGGGEDTLEGGDDVDRLYGDAGDDVMDGGLGNDLLYGGAGSDTMSGGAGNDTFYLLGEADFGSLGDPDRIIDWNTGDKINLTAVDADANLAGDQAFVLVSSFTNVAGQLVATYNSGTDETLVQMDVNGDGVADYALIVNGAATLAWSL